MTPGLGGRGITAGVLTIIIAVVVALLTLAIAIGVYHVGYSSLNALGTVAGSASFIGSDTLSITLTAVGGRAIIQGLVFYGPSGNQLFAIGDPPVWLTVIHVPWPPPWWPFPSQSTGQNQAQNNQDQLPSGCTLTIYNSTGTFNTWGRQILQAGQSVTIELTGTCGLDNIYQVQVIYNNGKSTLIPTGQW